MPLLRKSGVAIGREMSRGAAGLFDDLENNVDVKTAFKTRGGEVIDNLKRKAVEVMGGSGFKKRKIVKTRQSSTSRDKKKSKKNPLKKPKNPSKKTVSKAVKSKNSNRDYFS